MEKIELNKTYTFKFTKEDIKIGNLSFETICGRFRTGHVSGHFMEDFLEIWFDGIKTNTNRCTKGYDLISEDKPILHYECKTFTKYGANISPSYMVGSGRKYNKKDHIKISSDTIYAICDVMEFPIVRVRFIDGKEAVKRYGMKIKPKQRREFFGD